MVDFNKVDEYIGYIEEGIIPQGMTFNEFAMEFYHESKVIPMSKYLRSRGKTSKMPKIMNTKKEVTIEIIQAIKASRLKNIHI